MNMLCLFICLRIAAKWSDKTARGSHPQVHSRAGQIVLCCSVTRAAEGSAVVRPTRVRLDILPHRTSPLSEASHLPRPAPRVDFFRPAAGEQTALRDMACNISDVACAKAMTWRVRVRVRVQVLCLMPCPDPAETIGL